MTKTTNDCGSFVMQLAIAATGVDDPATQAWLRVRLDQDRPAELARVEAHWPRLTEREQESLYYHVVEGYDAQLEEDDVRIPFLIVSDYQALKARCERLFDGLVHGPAHG